MSNTALIREINQYESEKKLNQLAVKGYQNQMAEKLRGSMGEDMRKTLDPKKESNAWKRFKRGFDNFLNMLQ